MRYFETADDLLGYDSMPPDPYVADYPIDCDES
jgi:hypothetical protein